MPQHPPLLSLSSHLALPACLSLLMKHFPSWSAPAVLSGSRSVWTSLFCSPKTIWLFSSPNESWNKTVFLSFFLLLDFLCSSFAQEWIGTACRCAGGRLPEPKCFGVTCVPFSPSHTPLPLGLRAVVAHIYFISLMWVTPAWWWPLVSRSQIAVSEAYLWHDLWAGVTTDSQDCHCPATALNSRRRGALSALRQTRLPSLKRIKLFHHVGNEKAVITPN